MQKKLIALAIAGALAAPLATFAEDAPPASPFTGNFTIASEYLYRNIAQTHGHPAVQGGFDYAHPSGFYIGTWGSNISWISDTVPGASASLELDLYGGYKGTLAGDWGYDVGVLTYNYPGTGKPTGNAKPDTTELYGALSWKWLTAKYSYTTTSLFGWTQAVSGAKTRGSGYLELNANYELGEGLALVGHLGHQSVKGRSSASYSDFRLGVTKDVGIGTVGATLSTTNAKDSCAAGEDYCFGGYEAGKSRLLLTFGKTF